MTPSIYLLVGAMLLAVAAAAVHWREKSLITPGALVLLFYGVHCFLDPTLRYLGVHPRAFNPFTWETLTIHNALCYSALVIGYALPRGLLRRDKGHYLAARPARMFGRTGFWLVAFGCAATIGALFVGMAVLGRFSLPPNVFNAWRPPAYEVLVSLFPILYIIVPALAISAWFDSSRLRRRLTVGALVAMVAVFTMATLGRGLIFTVLLTTGIVWHFRYRKIKARHLAVAAGLVIFIALVALLRRAGTGITGIDLATIEHLAAAGRLGFLDGLFAYTVMISEGQVVVSNVIAFVEKTGLYHGRTWLDSVLSRTVPFYDPSLPQPMEWYRTLSGFRFGRSAPDFSIIAESYMNFGRAGFVVFVLVGLLARYCSHMVYTARSPVLLLWAAWMIVVLILATRTDSVALFTRAVWYIVPLIALRVGLSFLDASTRRFRAAERT